MDGNTPSKKVLIIAYYWPPAGGPGVQRVLKFAKYLPQYGWEPVILTVENGEYPATDSSLLEEIPEGIRVYKSKALEPYGLFKFFSGQKKDSKIDNYILKNKKPGIMSRLSKWIRFNVFIPDARLGWVPFAIRTGKQILEEENIDVIFSTSPPHSLQLTARRLARLSGKPWVADFRDPWSTIVYYQDESRWRLSRSIDSRMEKKVLRSADKVITISKAVSHDLNEIRQKNDTIVIYNGYDSADFKPVTRGGRSEKTIITYAGFLSDTRIPNILLQVLSEDSDQSFGPIELHIYGNTSPGFEEVIRQKKLEHRVVHHGYVNHSDLVRNLSLSDALLMVVDNVSDNKGILTGKLFDYMGTHRPIIAVGPVDGEVEDIIDETSTGWYISYENEEGMKNCLRELISQDYDFQFNTENFDRKNLTRSLAGVLDDLAGVREGQRP